MSFRKIWLMGALLAWAGGAAATVTEIELSYRLDRGRAEQLERVVEGFNAQSKAARVKLVMRTESGPAAVLNLATRDDVSLFVQQKSKFRPLHQLMAERKSVWDVRSLTPDLRVSVSDAQGKLLALPIAMSTPVLYYNKAAFRKAGLDPNQPPQTWSQVQEMAGKLRGVGLSCPYTTSWPVWIHVDNIAAINGADVATPKGQLTLNGLIHIKHIALLATWKKSNYFQYFGRRDEADRHFMAGECGMLTSGSYLAAALRDAPALDVGVAPLPYYDDVRSSPDHTLADGASLWISAGKRLAEYAATTQFIDYLLSTEMQVEFGKMGFLPLTPAARGLVESKLLAADLATLQVAYRQLRGAGAVHRIRVSQIAPLRALLEEEIEHVWEGGLPAKAALDTVVLKGGKLLPGGIKAASGG